MTEFDGSVLQTGKMALERLTAMIATWEAKREALNAQRYIIARGHSEMKDVEEGVIVKQIQELDASVVYALVSMIRLGGLAMADNQDPPSLIVSTDRITYGVSVLRSIGMRWSVDS
jgi:hypothetical protein